MTPNTRFMTVPSQWPSSLIKADATAVIHAVAEWHFTTNDARADAAGRGAGAAREPADGPCPGRALEPARRQPERAGAGHRAPPRRARLPAVHRGIRHPEPLQVRRYPSGPRRRGSHRELRRRRLWRSPSPPPRPRRPRPRGRLHLAGGGDTGLRVRGGGDGRGHAGAAMRDVKFDFADRVAVVTGAGKGIGRRISIAFAAAGAHVVLAGRHRETLEAVAKECAGFKGRALVNRAGSGHQSSRSRSGPSSSNNRYGGFPGPPPLHSPDDRRARRSEPAPPEPSSAHRITHPSKRRPEGRGPPKADPACPS